jgi:homoserine dehydrogenase
VFLNLSPHFTFRRHISGLVLVDCSATYDTVSLLKDAVDHGCCVVLANKKPLTGAYVILFDLLFSDYTLS